MEEKAEMRSIPLREYVPAARPLSTSYLIIGTYLDLSAKPARTRVSAKAPASPRTILAIAGSIPPLMTCRITEPRSAPIAMMQHGLFGLPRTIGLAAILDPGTPRIPLRQTLHGIPASACGLPYAASRNYDYLRFPASRESPKTRQSFPGFPRECTPTPVLRWLHKIHGRRHRECHGAPPAEFRSG